MASEQVGAISIRAGALKGRLRIALRRATPALALVLAVVFSVASPASAAIDGDVPHSGRPRIIGGTNTYIMVHPWQVEILLQNDSSCGGSIINNLWILTAAHCAIGADTILVRYGSSVSDPLAHSQTSGGISTARYFWLGKSFFVHPDYRQPNSPLSSDIALLELQFPLRFRAAVQPITLANSNIDRGLWPGRHVSATGWGFTDCGSETPPAQLQATTLVFQERVGRYYRLTSATGASGIALGDSGGPATVVADGRPVLIGVAKGLGKVPYCPASDSYYVSVAAHIDWICETIRNDNPGCPGFKPPPPAGPPDIVSWRNSVTNDTHLSFSATHNTAVRFHATANQSGNWTWRVDGTIRKNHTNATSDDFDLSFPGGALPSTRIVSVRAANRNGTSRDVSWTVTVTAPPRPPPLVIHQWGENDRKGHIGDIYLYRNPYNGKTEYFQLVRLGGDDRYWYFPINQTNNTYWRFVGTIRPPG